jgi:hypothetical protein
MRRSVLLGAVLAGMLAGCGGSGGADSQGRDVTTSQLDNGAKLPYHSVVVRGTRTFNPGELGVPLTVHCPQSGATGFKQVIRSPLKVGIGIFGGTSSGGGMTLVVSQSGAVTIGC